MNRPKPEIFQIVEGQFEGMLEYLEQHTDEINQIFLGRSVLTCFIEFIGWGSDVFPIMLIKKIFEILIQYSDINHGSNLMLASCVRDYNMRIYMIEKLIDSGVYPMNSTRYVENSGMWHAAFYSMHKLQAENKLLAQRLDMLEKHITYMPGGSGAMEAEADFNSRKLERY